jgi:betaine-aldehyde dehydrogenase
MMSLSSRLDQVATLRETLLLNRETLIRAGIQDCAFTYRESAIEVDLVQELAGFSQMAETLAPRLPLAGPGQEVALILPYNGIAWLNTAIASIYLVGNRVRVKFAGRVSRIAHLTESLYRPIFGDDIIFDYSNGKDFMQRAFEDPDIVAICMFGSDYHALRYEKAARTFKKKFVFEGPGNDPFIVLDDADLEAAAKELAFSKYIYAGQTCTAPERIYIHDRVFDDFMDHFLDLSRKVRRGDLDDPDTEIGPVISQKAIRAIHTQLKDAVAKGGRIVLGGDIEGNFVPPTVVVDATPDMLGMQDETFGPVSFVAKFSTTEEAIRLACNNRYGLRATIYGQADAEKVFQALIGEPYCHPVESIRFGVFGNISVNQPRSQSLVGAFVSQPVGGYGYSGWIWETLDGTFVLKQGPKLLSLETSRQPE